MSTTHHASRRIAIAATAGLIATAALLLAACGSATKPAAGPHAAIAADAGSSLGTSVSTTAATWATVVMGGSAAQYNDFWQLFVRPSGSADWKLDTPPGTADNGGLVLASGGGSDLITAFRPSNLLTYTPLNQTSDAGRTWSAINPLDAALANTPAAVAVQPDSGRLLALGASGTAEETTAGSSTWHTLATTHTVAATPAGRHCGLTELTAVAWQDGIPLLAGSCSHPGTAGIFAWQNGMWQAAGPALPASLAGQDVSVSRLGVAGSQTVALLTIGAGRTGRLVAAWSGTGSPHWTLSPPLSLESTSPAPASFGPGGLVAVITGQGHGALIARNDTSWRQLPALPPRTATLAPSADGQVDALAARGGMLTVWRLGQHSTTWIQAQVIKVPIEYGSST